MAEYFETKDQAEKWIRQWYADDGAPAFFGKILNHGVEKWIVNYDRGQHPVASPHIKILEDHSDRIKDIVTSATALGVALAAGLHEEKSATDFAIKEGIFRRGEGSTPFVLRFDRACKEFRRNGMCVEISGQVRCTCGTKFPFRVRCMSSYGDQNYWCPNCKKNARPFVGESRSDETLLILGSLVNDGNPVRVAVERVDHVRWL